MSDRVHYMLLEETRPQTPYSEAGYFYFPGGLKLRVADHDEWRSKTVTLQHFGKEFIGEDFACLMIPKTPLRNERRTAIRRGLVAAARIKNGHGQG